MSRTLSRSLLGAALLATIPAAASAQYSATPLGALLSGYSSLGTMLTPDGRVAGVAASNLATVTGPDGSATGAVTLTRPSGTTGPVFGMAANDAGVATGWTIVGGYARSYRWTGAGSAAVDLGTVAPYASVQSNDVNATGRIVGTLGDPTPYSAANLGRGFYQDAGGAITALAPASGGTSSAARGVNDAGRVVGQTNTFVGYYLQGAAYWDATGPATYGLAKLIPNTFNGMANEVNAGGAAVGYAYATGAGAAQRAFYWNGNASTTAQFIDWLPAFTGSQSGEAKGINAAGLVVGQMGGLVGSVNQSRAFSWNSATNALVDLSGAVAGWTLTEARGVNDDGQILAFGNTGTVLTPSYREQWFLLTPTAVVPSVTTPEPSTLALLAGALGTLGAATVARRRRNR